MTTEITRSAIERNVAFYSGVLARAVEMLRAGRGSLQLASELESLRAYDLSPIFTPSQSGEHEGYPGIAHDYETLRHALLNIASYQGRGPMNADWQGIVYSLGKQAREALQAVDHRAASTASSTRFYALKEWDKLVEEGLDTDECIVELARRAQLVASAIGEKK